MTNRLIIIILLLSSYNFSFGQQKSTPPNVNIDGFPLEKSKVFLYQTDSISNAETLVLIDKKIYSLASPEFRKLTFENIKDLQIIKDELSATRIKTILMITTKTP